MVVNMVISAFYEFCIPQWQQLIIGFVNFLHAYICYPVSTYILETKYLLTFKIKLHKLAFKSEIISTADSIKLWMGIAFDKQKL